MDIIKEIQDIDNLPVLLWAHGIYLPVKDIIIEVKNGNIVDENSLHKFIEQCWQKGYSMSVFKPIAWLKSMDKEVIRRAGPLLRRLLKTPQNVILGEDKVEVFLNKLDDLKVNSGGDWVKVFNFVKQTFGHLNEFLPVMQIAHIAKEEMPTLSFAIADNIEERELGEEGNDFFEILEGEVKFFNQDIKEKFISVWGDVAKKLMAR